MPAALSNNVSSAPNDFRSVLGFYLPTTDTRSKGKEIIKHHLIHHAYLPRAQLGVGRPLARSSFFFSTLPSGPELET